MIATYLSGVFDLDPTNEGYCCEAMGEVDEVDKRCRLPISAASLWRSFVMATRDIESNAATRGPRPATMHLDLQEAPVASVETAHGTARTGRFTVRDAGLRKGLATFAGKVLRDGSGMLTVTTPQGPRKLRLQVVPDDDAASGTGTTSGSPRITPEVAEAVARARARGQQAAAAILDGPDMLAGVDLGTRMGMSRQAVHKAAAEGRLLALTGGSRAVRYPAWQLDETGARLGGLTEVLSILGQGWPSYRFLAAPSADGRTAWERLAAGETAAVLAEARACAQGDFG